MLTPRPYQQAAHERIWAELDGGKRSVVCCLPTGGGKTIVAYMTIRRVLEAGGTVLFMAHRFELLKQPSKLLDSLGIDHGWLKSGHPRKRPWCPVQIGSVQTLASKLKLGGELPRPDLVIVDETHLIMSTSYLTVLAAMGNPRVLGLTATPTRLDGKPLGDVYESMVVAATGAQLVAEGYLVAPRRCVPRHVDWGAAKSDKALADAFGKSEIHGNVVADWLRHANGRPTILFAASVEHSKRYVEEFKAAGVASAHVDGNTAEGVRERAFDDLASGALQVVSNVDIATEGLDIPTVSCVQLARPTYSLVKYLQMIGRCMRPSPGKTDALILDHAGLTIRHGLPLEHREWSLDGEAKSGNGKVRGNLKICGNCFEVTELPARCCDFCGEPWRTGARRGPEEVGGELIDTCEGVEICGECRRGCIIVGSPDRYGRIDARCNYCGHAEKRTDEAVVASHDDTKRKAYFDWLIGQAKSKRFKPYWVAHRYTAKYKAEPLHAVARRAAAALGK